MKCHFIYDKEAGKVLIPGCYGSIHRNDMSMCTCRDYPETFAQFERKEYNETVSKLKSEIKDLEKENARLNRILKRLYKVK